MTAHTTEEAAPDYGGGLRAIVMDRFVPALRDITVRALYVGIETLFYGEERPMDRPDARTLILPVAIYRTLADPYDPGADQDHLEAVFPDYESWMISAALASMLAYGAITVDEDGTYMVAAYEEGY